MRRPLYPRRRPPAAALRTFSGRTVTPVPGTKPVADVTTTSATAARAALASPVPPHGTHIKISAHRAGAMGVIRAERALSTGRFVQGRRMDHEARVLPAEEGVRFGVYTSLMTTQAIFTTPAVAVGR
jgi:hypothetical protein